MNVVIVESHQHVLEHIHATIRRQKLFNKRWSMLHFDAHPDLACPTAPAISCFTPRQPIPAEEGYGEQDLYERLDSTSSGIAEWILPLVLAADLRFIEWVKPPFATQLPLGRHQYKVGAYDGNYNAMEVNSFLDLPTTARVKVDFSHSYYWEDDSVVPTQSLALAQDLELCVTELNRSRGLFVTENEENLESLWALDICLDYFSCLNPYLTDIEKEDPVISRTFLQVMQKSRHYSSTDNQPNGETQVKELPEFRRLLVDVLQPAESSSKTSNLLDRLRAHFDSPDEGMMLIEELRQLLQKKEKASSLILEAIPYWNMPHALSTIDAVRINKSIRQVEDALLRYQTRPFLVTIARSSDDGFTPASVVEDIQEKVLQMLHRVFCESSNAAEKTGDFSLRVTKDYGRWEGSTIE